MRGTIAVLGIVCTRGTSSLCYVLLLCIVLARSCTYTHTQLKEVPNAVGQAIDKVVICALAPSTSH